MFKKSNGGWLGLLLIIIPQILLAATPLSIPQDGSAASRVRRYINYYQNEGQLTMHYCFSKPGVISTMTEILEKRGLPRELVCVAMVESGFNAHALSRKGARGWWQFIASTGRRYGLKNRSHLEQSTQAAAKYLADLYQEFGDWHLALAAYNTGEENIELATSHQRHRNFWALRRGSQVRTGTILSETYNFVPQVLALVHLARKHGVFEGKYQPATPPLKMAKKSAGAGSKRTMADRRQLLAQIREIMGQRQRASRLTPSVADSSRQAITSPSDTTNIKGLQQ